eukprot:5750313-Prymnesium_polylepis.1
MSSPTAVMPRRTRRCCALPAHARSVCSVLSAGSNTSARHRAAPCARNHVTMLPSALAFLAKYPSAASSSHSLASPCALGSRPLGRPPPGGHWINLYTLCAASP